MVLFYKISFYFYYGEVKKLFMIVFVPNDLKIMTSSFFYPILSLSNKSQQIYRFLSHLTGFIGAKVDYTSLSAVLFL